MRNRKIVVTALIIVFAALLVGCEGRGGKAASTEPPTVTVEFYDGDTELIASQSVPLDGVPNWVGAKKAGCVLTGWMDAAGAEAQPFSTPVTRELRYCAQWRAVPTEHTPYLFPDERGFLRPNDIMTQEELGAAVKALCTQEAEPYLPALPAGDSPVNGAVLSAVTEAFFPGSGAALAGKGALTRAQVATILNGLLGRGASEQVELLPEATLPPDLDSTRSDYYQLLEACVPHTAGGTAGWDNTVIPPLLQPGFVHFDGVLYCVDEQGSFIRNSDLGLLHFDARGRYTCGNAVLDSYIREILVGLMEENPGAESLELLRAAFLYTRDSFSYLRRNAYAFRATGWEIDDAIMMLETGRGNCYCYAAVFMFLARQLGYEARAFSGTVSQTAQPHGWVEIEIDGTNYYFDPELEMTYVNKRNPVPDMFMMTYARASGWSYRK